MLEQRAAMDADDCRAFIFIFTYGTEFFANLQVSFSMKSFGSRARWEYYHLTAQFINLRTGQSHFKLHDGDCGKLYQLIGKLPDCPPNIPMKAFSRPGGLLKTADIQSERFTRHCLLRLLAGIPMRQTTPVTRRDFWFIIAENTPKTRTVRWMTSPLKTHSFAWTC